LILVVQDNNCKPSNRFRLICSVLPHAHEWDEKEIFPVDVLKKLAELGFAAIYVKDEFGGTGVTRMDAALIFENLSTACPSTTAYLSIHNMCFLIR